MKTHKTFTITKKFLASLEACVRGVSKIEHLLPAKISTDPEQNIALAIEIAEVERSTDAGWADTWWLAAHALQKADTFYPDAFRGWPDSYNFDNAGANPDADPFVVAQYLAWAADALLTKQGK